MSLHKVNKSKRKGYLNIKAFLKFFHIVFKYGNSSKTPNKAIKIYKLQFISDTSTSTNFLQISKGLVEENDNCIITYNLRCY